MKNKKILKGIFSGVALAALVFFNGTAAAAPDQAASADQQLVLQNDFAARAAAPAPERSSDTGKARSAPGIVAADNSFPQYESCNDPDSYGSSYCGFLRDN